MGEAKKSGEEIVVDKVEKDIEQGYHGTVPDPTPNENYSVAGVTAGKPTPETDEELRQKARSNAGLS